MSLPVLIERCLGERDAVALGREQAAHWADWLLPIDAAAPAGEDPACDDDFQRLREEVNKLSAADAPQVLLLAEKLLKQRCKDLRVASYYAWARLQMQGEAGLAAGLGLLAALVEHYPDQVLPVRGNGRRMAVEWLTSARVLDSLALYPDVVMAEAERTVAALAWLAQAVLAWPVEQRPALGGLYGALSARLTQAGGAQAQALQNKAAPEAGGQALPQAAAAIKSGRDVLDSGRQLAAYLREQPLGWLAAHRLIKSLRWDTLHHVPPHDASGKTRLAPPRSEYRAQLKGLYLQQNWPELLEQAERMYAEGVNHFWLDLQCYLYQALSHQPAPQEGWAAIIKRDFEIFLARLPGLQDLCWNDGSPFADPATVEWINREFGASTAPSWPASAATTAVLADDPVLALEGEALARADSEGVEQTLAWLAARPDLHAGRQRWLLRLLMARVAEQYGKNDLAIYLLTELDTTARRQALADWEPALDFEVKARLLRLLRLKTQRGDADKPELARRSETLLAALVALDPVRAAVLCG
ncbi:type VI secretion protein [Pseudomonas sp. Leaf127]|uniref:type VI secretion system protein TssA n=1 Tax=Pseudomonas sp. Leaf127 TaxID=1736267 RepID=UPI000702418B|nr:type VI secretion system protein TssA [Pseudomonas sp. Leaf127]KQQ56029.1 type VI secretion protein [Pseudomonas sp. Leaf127]